MPWYIAEPEERSSFDKTLNGKPYLTGLDEGTPRWEAGTSDTTRWDYCYIEPSRLLNFFGKNNEHLLLAKHPHGRLTDKEWAEFTENIRVRGEVVWPVVITKEKNGFVYIMEGNHRIRAAVEVGIEKIRVEFRYYGNSQKNGLIYNPEQDILSMGGKAPNDRIYEEAA